MKRKLEDLSFCRLAPSYSYRVQSQKCLAFAMVPEKILNQTGSSLTIFKWSWDLKTSSNIDLETDRPYLEIK